MGVTSGTLTDYPSESSVYNGLRLVKSLVFFMVLCETCLSFSGFSNHCIFYHSNYCFLFPVGFFKLVFWTVLIQSKDQKKNSIFWNIKMYFSDNHCLAIPIAVAVLMYVIWLISTYAINVKVRFPLLTRYSTLFDRVCWLVFPGYFGYIHI